MRTSTWSILVLCCGLLAATCKNKHIPAPSGKSKAPVRRVRTPPRRTEPSTQERIPPPPMRMDVRVTRKELQLLPRHAPLVVALRPDFLGRLAAPQGWWSRTLGARVPWAALRAWLPPQVHRAWGLDPKRAVVAALLYSFPAAAGKRPDLRIRLVAAVAAPDKTRAALKALGDKRLFGTTRAATSASGATVTWSLASGIAVRAALRDKHLVVDAVIRTAPPFSAPGAVRALSTPPPPARGSILDNVFARVMLLAGADLTLLVDAKRTATAARWLGLRQAEQALPLVNASDRPRLRKLAETIARIPERFAGVTPHAFRAFALQLYQVTARPQLWLTWQLTPAGRRIVEPMATEVSGRDLGAEKAFIDQWLKPVAARTRTVLPAVGPWKDPELPRLLQEGGAFMWLDALADFWPRLFTHKAARARVLALFRTGIRPGRFIARVNVQRKGDLLQLRVEGKAPKATPPGGAASKTPQRVPPPRRPPRTPTKR